MSLPVILDPAWTAALREAVRAIVPKDFYGQMTLRIQAGLLGDRQVEVMVQPRPVDKPARRA